MNTSAKGTLFIITASSGTGKTSLVKALLDSTDNIAVSISHTTRSPRPNETDGQDYHFSSVEQFEQDIEKEHFLEYAQVFDNYYGTAKSSVQELLSVGTDVILEIDWQGALQVQQIYQDGKLVNFIDELCLIFILPPDADALRERLSSRGQDSDEVIEKRLAGAVTEMRHYDKFDYVIINDNFEQALTELSAIVLSNRQQTSKQKIRHTNLIKNLLA